MIQTEWVDQKVVFLRRNYREQAELPRALVENRFCLICGKYGCVTRFITQEFQGGKRTGDNLLPVCQVHAYCSIVDLYQDHIMVRHWMIDHERIDVILLIEDRLKGRNRG